MSGNPVREVVILTHGDADGVTAGAIAKSIYRNAEVYFTHPVGLLEDFREFAADSKMAIILDISLDERLVGELLREFKEYRGRLLYIDHHPLPVDPSALLGVGVELVHEEGACAAELAFRHLKPGWEMSRVALYGAIGDYALNTPFVRDAMLKWDIKTLFLEAGVLVLGLDYLGRDYEAKRGIVEELSRNELPSSISELLVAAAIQAKRVEDMRRRLPELVETGEHVAYVINPPGSLGLAAFYARVVAAKPVGVGVEERGESCILSLRAGDPRVDLNSIVRRVAPVQGGHGGGHKQAAGARVPRGRLIEFLEKLDREVGEALSGGRTRK
ncbi:MAG: phosphoesterase [Thermoprotei archaeon]|nr:MAG: phosphoesterase [Thermoprotei archaeon]